MACLFEHNWGWPRRRGDKDMQVCLDCGSERESSVLFGEPRYTKTQDGSANSSPVTIGVPEILEASPVTAR